MLYYLYIISISLLYYWYTIIPIDVGMVMEWEQPTGLLYATGDVKYIRVWDTHKELKISDIPTGAESCVSSLALDHCDKSLMVAGCGDGTIRLYDRRHPSSSR